MFQQVALSQSHIVRLVLALEHRAVRLGDDHGALLLAMLLSDESKTDCFSLGMLLSKILEICLGFVWVLAHRLHRFAMAIPCYTYMCS